MDPLKHSQTRYSSPSPPSCTRGLRRITTKLRRSGSDFTRKVQPNRVSRGPESVDEALCFGWIDSVRRSVNETSYTNRFTKRKARSTWSAVNIRRAKELISLGRMQPAGIKAFEQRSDERSAIYSYEQRQSAKLSGAFEKQFRANKKAWKFFRAQAPWYQRVAAFWVVSAKKDDTRLKRLAKLIEDSENGRTIPPLTRPQRTE